MALMRRWRPSFVRFDGFSSPQVKPAPAPADALRVAESRRPGVLIGMRRADAGAA
jgi:hypothetical protein